MRRSYALPSILGVLACAEPPPTAPPPPPPHAPLISIFMTPSPASIAPNDSVQIRASSNFGETTWAWSSAKPAIATVTSDGLVRGVSAGVAAIAACSVTRPGYCGAASVVVQ